MEVPLIPPGRICRRGSLSIKSAPTGDDETHRLQEGTLRQRTRNLALCVEDRAPNDGLNCGRGLFQSAAAQCRADSSLKAVLFRVAKDQYGAGDDFPKELATLRFSALVPTQFQDLWVDKYGFDNEGRWAISKSEHEGALSRLFPITHLQTGMPVEAAYFAFAYPGDGASNVDHEQDRPLIAHGGFLYIDARFAVVAVHAISPGKEGDISVSFSVPNWLSAVEIRQLEAEGPFRTIPKSWHLPEHITKFRWIEAQCGGTGSHGIPLGFPSGGLCFLGRFDKSDRDTVSSDAARASESEQRDDEWWQQHVDDLMRLADGEQDSHKAHNVHLKKGLAKKDVETRKDFVKQARARFKVIEEGGVFEKVIFGGLWLRFPYAFMMFILLVVALFSGIQMQLFFTIFQHRQKDSTLGMFFISVLFCIPLITTGCAVAIDQLVDLLWDTFDQPYLKRLRSTWIVAWAPKPWTKECKKDQLEKMETGPARTPTAKKDYLNEFCVPNLDGNRNTIWRANALLLVCLEVVPLVTLACEVLKTLYGPSVLHIPWIATPASWLTFNINAGLGSRLAAGYFAGLLANVVLLTLALTFADFKLHQKEAAWRSKTHTMHDDRGPRWEQESIEAALSDYRLFPSCAPWRLKSDTDDAVTALKLAFTLPMTAEHCAGNEKVDSAFYRSKVFSSSQQAWFWPAMMWVPWIIAMLCIWQGMVESEDPWHVWQRLMLIASCMALATWGTSQLFKLKFPEVVGLPFHFSIGMFSFFLLAWIFSGKFVLPLRTDTKTLLPMMSVSVNTSLPVEWPDPKVARPYSICQQQWGSEHASVDALDLAALSWIAYDQQSPRSTNTSCYESMPLLLEQHFSPAPQLLTCMEYEVFPPRFMSVMFGQGENENKTIVIAIKGTSTGPDLYLDIDLYAAVKVLQAFAFISPVLQAMPAEVIQKLIFYSKLLGGVGRELESEVWGAVTDEIGRLEVQYPNASIVLTGHSFGGTLAEIGAAQRGKSALVWSAPGTLFSSQYLDVTREAMQRDVTVVVPDMDIVPRTDVHQSTVQHIQCKNADGSLPHFSDCHPLMKSACEVWRVCGDRQKRHFNCAEYVSRTFLGKLFPDDAWR